MGAWGARSFDNDDAMDFVAELESNGSGALQEAIDEAVDLAPEDYLEAPSASRAVAAAEVAAAMLGFPAPDLPPAVVEWLSTAPAPDPLLRASATAALQRVVANSELAELWAESGDDSWREQQADLLQRIAATA
jgi:hypothetical protein